MIESKSLSSNKPNSCNRVKSSKSKKSKKNNSCSITLNHNQNPQNIISEFKLKSSKNKKRKLLSKKINIIINNNSFIQSNQPINSYFNNKKGMNSFLDEKPIKEIDLNSTFVYTGDNCSFFDNNNIFNQYLRAEEKKEEKIIQPSQKDSFTLISSTNSMNLKKSEKNKFNQKLLKLMKKTNINNNKNNNDFRKYNENAAKWKDNKKNNLKKEENNLAYNKKRKKIIFFVFFISVNLLFYFFLIMKIFEPCVSKLFFDNDHDNYIYKTSLLSQDTRIIVNNK